MRPGTCRSHDGRQDAGTAEIGVGTRAMGVRAVSARTRRAVLASSTVVALTGIGLTGFGLTASSSAAGPAGTANPADAAAPVDLAPGWPDGGRAVAVNEAGQVVVLGGPEPGAYLWTAGRLTPLAHEGAPITPVDLNDRGQVVGTVLNDAGLPSVVLWEGGRSRLLPVPGEGAQPLDLNNRGQVTALGVASPPAPAPGVRAYLYDGRDVVDLGVELFAVQPSLVLNEAGQVAGTKVAHGGPVYGTPSGFLWTRGLLVDVGTLGGEATQVTDLNERGQVVGRSTLASGSQHGFLWQNGTITDLGTSSGDFSEAVAVNDSGVVVGQATTSDGAKVAIVWSQGAKTELPVVGASSQAVAVNNRGQVVVSSFAAAGPGTRYVTKGYRWRAGRLTPLGTLGGPGANPATLNESGSVVGATENTAEQPRAALWQ